MPEIAENGALALDACKKKDFQLVLMDVQMPEMDGLEATEKILEFCKENDKTAPTILAMTANVLGESKEKCLNAGMLGFISKPVSPSELEESLKKWLEDYLIID
jgi:CheY-like chemotaxis protein